MEREKMKIKLEDARIKRSDYQVALICCVLANIHRDKRKKPTPYKVQDFLLKTGARKKQTAQEQFAIVKLLNAALGGNVV